MPFPEIPSSQAVSQVAQDVGSSANDLPGDVETVTGEWGKLTGVYESPESPTVYTALDRLPGAADEILEALRSAKTALETYASELKTLEDRKAELQSEQATLDGSDAEPEELHSDQVVLDGQKAALQTALDAADEECAGQLRSLINGRAYSDLFMGDTAHPAMTSTYEQYVRNSDVRAAKYRLSQLSLDQTGTYDPIGATIDGIGDTAGVMGATSVVMANLYHGRFAPRGEKGRYTAYKHLSRSEQGKLARAPWRDIRNAHDPKQFSAKPHHSAARAGWLKVGKVAGPVGTVASFASGAWDQWSADAEAGYDTDERIGRAATRSALVGGGGVAGAAVGAKVGALAGSFAGPVGTVVGGIAGGVIGGALGSGIGGKVADKVVDFGGEVASKVSDLGSKVGDIASSVGDKLAFWK